MIIFPLLALLVLPRGVQALPQPAPNPSIVIVTNATTPGDSIRAILERDLSNGDRIDVLVLDSASRAALVLASDGQLDSAELAQYTGGFALSVVWRGSSVRLSLYRIAQRRIVRRATFHLAADTAGLPIRWQLHQIADHVEEWITGKSGISATRIAYVYEDTIHVIDADGSDDHKFPAQGTALSPSWHPRGTSLLFSDLADAGTQIGRIDLPKGTVHLFAMTPRGLNITPHFTPRGDSIIFATAGAHGTRLVIGSALGRGHVHPYRLHMPPDMHDMAEPTFSPNGRSVAFVASRPLYPQIYTMWNDGRHIQRFIPYKPGLRNERTAPDWSPDGRTIAYQQQNHQFQIWIAPIHRGIADTTIRLTSEAENRDPSWAPDSRHLVVTSTRGGDQQLWILDIVSGRGRQLPNIPGARLAAWSPRLRS